MDFPTQFLGDTWYAELDAHLSAYVVKAITDACPGVSSGDGDPILGWMQRENGAFVWVGTTHALRTAAIDHAVRECLTTLNARC